MASHIKQPIVPKQYILTFILTTCCFSLWGFANDFTNPLVKVFEQVFIITTAQASWLQFAFYTGYFCMAIPAVMFIRKFSYKAAIMLGLGILPAAEFMQGAREFFFPEDVVFGVVKSFVFGFVITSISSFKGYYASGGAEGVGNATTQATVLSCIYVLLSDFVLAALLL